LPIGECRTADGAAVDRDCERNRTRNRGKRTLEQDLVGIAGGRHRCRVPTPRSRVGCLLAHDARARGLARRLARGARTLGLLLFCGRGDGARVAVGSPHLCGPRGGGARRAQRARRVALGRVRMGGVLDASGRATGRSPGCFCAGVEPHPHGAGRAVSAAPPAGVPDRHAGLHRAHASLSAGGGATASALWLGVGGSVGPLGAAARQLRDRAGALRPARTAAIRRGMVEPETDSSSCRVSRVALRVSLERGWRVGGVVRARARGGRRGPPCGRHAAARVARREPRQWPGGGRNVPSVGAGSGGLRRRAARALERLRAGGLRRRTGAQQCAVRRRLGASARSARNRGGRFPGPRAAVETSVIRSRGRDLGHHRRVVGQHGSQDLRAAGRGGFCSGATPLRRHRLSRCARCGPEYRESVQRFSDARAHDFRQWRRHRLRDGGAGADLRRHPHPDPLRRQRVRVGARDLATTGVARSGAAPLSGRGIGERAHGADLHDRTRRLGARGRGAPVHDLRTRRRCSRAAAEHRGLWCRVLDRRCVPGRRRRTRSRNRRARSSRRRIRLHGLPARRADPSLWR